MDIVDITILVANDSQAVSLWQEKREMDTARRRSMQGHSLARHMRLPGVNYPDLRIDSSNLLPR